MVVCPSPFYFQSTLPLRGATSSSPVLSIAVDISIHTPLAGSDTVGGGRAALPEHFNPHSPCGERPVSGGRAPPGNYFNPHSPCGERLFRGSYFFSVSDFNPHSPCGERPGVVLCQKIILVISIHTPLAGSDSKSYLIHIKFKNKIYDIRNKNKLRNFAIICFSYLLK